LPAGRQERDLCASGAPVSLWLKSCSCFVISIRLRRREILDPLAQIFRELK